MPISPRRARTIRLQVWTWCAHSSGISESTARRARASSPRLVSCVEVHSMRRFHCRARSAFALWKCRHRHAEASRITTHFVERRQTIVAIEGRVLESLGHHRTAVLLQFHGAPQHGARLKPLWLSPSGRPKTPLQEIQTPPGRFPRRYCAPERIAQSDRADRLRWERTRSRRRCGTPGKQATIADRAPQEVVGEVGGIGFSAPPAPHARQHIQFARHFIAHDAHLQCVTISRERHVTPGELRVGLREAPLRRPD